MRPAILLLSLILIGCGATAPTMQSGNRLTFTTTAFTHSKIMRNAETICHKQGKQAKYLGTQCNGTFCEASFDCVN